MTGYLNLKSFLLIVLSYSALSTALYDSSIPFIEEFPITEHPNAYLSLLYSDFSAGIRTLGASLRLVKANADLVVLVTPDVSKDTKMVLRRDGWKVVSVSPITNPNKDALQHFSHVYTKLLAFTITQYSKVILLDGDTLILENIDELFSCGPLCGVMGRHELLDTGLLVIEPNLDTFKSFYNKYETTYSYSGGFEGFLNMYFDGFAYCDFFDPMGSNDMNGKIFESKEIMKQTAPLPVRNDCKRLPTRYNGDLFLILVNGALSMVRAQNEMPEEFWRRREARMVHFHFSLIGDISSSSNGVKPWFWWAAPFLPYIDRWEQIYLTLDIDDTTEGSLRGLGSVIMLILPLFIPYLTYRFLTKKYDWNFFPQIQHFIMIRSIKSTVGNPTNGPIVLLLQHICFFLIALWISIRISFSLVPSNVPSVAIGWFQFLLWVYCLFFSSCSIYLSKCYTNGKVAKSKNTQTHSTNQNEEDENNVIINDGNSPPLYETFGMGLIFIGLTFLIPSWRSFIGLNSLAAIFPPIIGVLALILILVTIAAIRIPFIWFRFGAQKQILNDISSDSNSYLS